MKVFGAPGTGEVHALEVLWDKKFGVHPCFYSWNNYHLKYRDIPLTLFSMGVLPPLPYKFFPCNFYKRRNYPPKRSDF